MWITEPLLIECWIMALAALANGTEAGLHADTYDEIATWSWPHRPRA